VVFNLEHGVWSRTDRTGHAGAFRQKQNINQRPLLADPIQKTNYGKIFDCGASDKYGSAASGTVSSGIPGSGIKIKSLLDTVPHGGDDPISIKNPRRTYVTGICRDGSQAVTIGVTTDEWQNLTTQSGQITIKQDLTPHDVWWGGNKHMEGSRVGYRLKHFGSGHLTIESIVSEHRVRGRR
jgi:hypothetical protein